MPAERNILAEALAPEQLKRRQEAVVAIIWAGSESRQDLKPSVCLVSLRRWERTS